MKPLPTASLAGVFRVDPSCCIDCGLCRRSSAELFVHVPDERAYRLCRQPETEAERALMASLQESCPTQAIVLKKV